MPVELTTLTSRVIGVAFASGSRPALVFCLLDLAVAAGIRWGGLRIEPSFAWLVAPTALVAGVVVATLETVMRHQDELEERELHLDRILVLVGASFSSLLLTAVGVPVPPELGQQAPVTAVAALDHPAWLKLGSVGGAVALAEGQAWLRARIAHWLSDLGLEWIWRNLEAGGVLGLLLVAALLPALVPLLVVLVATLLGATALVVRAVDQARDARRRRPCPQCRHRVREEAVGCPDCGAELEPLRWLGARDEP